MYYHSSLRYRIFSPSGQFGYQISRYRLSPYPQIPDISSYRTVLLPDCRIIQPIHVSQFSLKDSLVTRLLVITHPIGASFWRHYSPSSPGRQPAGYNSSGPAWILEIYKLRPCSSSPGRLLDMPLRPRQTTGYCSSSLGPLLDIHDPVPTDYWIYIISPVLFDTCLHNSA